MQQFNTQKKDMIAFLGSKDVKNFSTRNVKRKIQATQSPSPTRFSHNLSEFDKKTKNNLKFYEK